MDSLGTAHSKMGGPTFVNGRVDRILKKVVHICLKNFTIVVNFETKVRRRLLLYECKIIHKSSQKFNPERFVEMVDTGKAKNSAGLSQLTLYINSESTFR